MRYANPGVLVEISVWIDQQSRWKRHLDRHAWLIQAQFVVVVAILEICQGEGNGVDLGAVVYREGHAVLLPVGVVYLCPTRFGNPSRPGRAHHLEGARGAAATGAPGAAELAEIPTFGGTGSAHTSLGPDASRVTAAA